MMDLKKNEAHNEPLEGEPNIEYLPYDSVPNEDIDYSSDENNDKLEYNLSIKFKYIKIYKLNLAFMLFFIN